MTFSVGLVGCGDVARRYATAMNGAVEGLRLQAAWDIVHKAGADFAKRFGVELLTSFEEFLLRPFDLVCVCTPNNTHSAVVEACLETGFNVLVEHPLAISVADGERLCRLAAQCERRLFVVRQRRFLGPVQLLRAVLARELLGGIQKVTAIMIWNRRPEFFASRTWRMRRENGGVVLNQASHFLDILLYIFGEPSSVEGIIGNLHHNMPVEDAARGVITFINGVEVEFACTTAAPPGYNWSQLIICGTQGNLTLSGKGWEMFETTIDNATITELAGMLEAPLSGDHFGYFQRVARRLSGEVVEIVDAKEGMNTVRLIDRIYRSFKPDNTTLRNYFLPLFQGVQK